MSTLLLIIVAVLGVIVLVQLLKVTELAKVLKNEKPWETTDSENRFHSGLFFLFMLVFFGFTIWLITSYGDKLLPVSASEHGVATDALLDLNHFVIIVVFFIVNFILALFAFSYYKKEGRKATFFTHSNKLELLWTTVPALFLAVIIIYGLNTWNTITAEPAEDAVLIELYSKQFDWTARYPGNDGKLGDYHYTLIDGTNPLGINKTDAGSQDDIIVKGEFHIPVNKEISFVFRSQDVIHSAYMPHFRAQMNTVPGMTTQFHFKPTITTAQMRSNLNNQEFNYVLLCNKICGSAHYNMQMNIVVDTEEDYNKWLKEQKTFLSAQL